MDVRLLLDASADRHDPFGLRQVNGLLGLLERRFRLLADVAGVCDLLQRTALANIQPLPIEALVEYLGVELWSPMRE